MPSTTRSSRPVSRSGYIWTTPPPSKRKRSNADETTRKRHKDEDVDNEGHKHKHKHQDKDKDKDKEVVEKREKRGREGKKAQEKRGKSIRKTSADKAREEAAAFVAAKDMKKTERALARSGHAVAPPGRSHSAMSPLPATTTSTQTHCERWSDRKRDMDTDADTVSDDPSNSDPSDTNHDSNSADTNSNMTDSDHDDRRSGTKSPDGTQDASGSDDNNDVPMCPTPRRTVGSVEAAVTADDDTFATTSSVFRPADDTMGTDTCATLSQAHPSPLPGNVPLHLIPGVAMSGSNLTGPHSPFCAPITLDQSDAAPTATLGLGVSVEDPSRALD
ncbi:hypothetical protein CVT25_007646, partial [Psilocybe cyanescens]